MAERAEPLVARGALPFLPVLKRMATMPLRDPFACAGVVIYILFALVVLAIVGFIAYRWRAVRREDQLKRAAAAAGPGHPDGPGPGPGQPDAPGPGERPRPHSHRAG